MDAPCLRSNATSYIVGAVREKNGRACTHYPVQKNVFSVTCMQIYINVRVEPELVSYGDVYMLELSAEGATVDVMSEIIRYKKKLVFLQRGISQWTAAHEEQLLCTCSASHAKQRLGANKGNTNTSFTHTLHFPAVCEDVHLKEYDIYFPSPTERVAVF